MNTQKDLPLPQTDLPRPEKELQQGSEPKAISKNKWIIFTVLALALLFATLFGGYFLGAASKPKAVACTQEAKLCPDGSSVGRTGPKCEFTKCPTVTSSWKTFTGKYFSLSIPSDWNIAKDPVTYDGVTFFENDFLTSSDNKYQLRMTIEDLKNKATLDDLAFNTNTTGKITVGGEPAVRELMAVGQSGETYSGSISINHKGLRYLIEIATKYDKANNQEVDKDIEEMISTFKFIDSTDETANIIRDLTPIENPDNNPNAKMEVLKIIGNYAQVYIHDISGIGGSGVTAMKENGVWKELFAGQNGPGCSQVIKYPDFPKELCLEKY